MKYTITTLLALVSLVGTSQAETFTVDNRTDGIAQFSTFRDAYDQAVDTIVLTGSPIRYIGGIVLKRLNIIGPGYFEVGNFGSNPYEAELELSFRSAAGGATFPPRDPSGSSVRGLVLSERVGSNDEIVDDYVSSSPPITGITFDKCRFPSVVRFGQGAQVTRSYFDNFGIFERRGQTLVSNCVFRRRLTIQGATEPDRSLMNIDYCVIEGGLLDSNAFVGGENVHVTNTIFYDRDGIDPVIENGATITNSMVIGTDTLPAESGNQTVGSLSEVFATGYGSEASRYVLKSGSPAVGAGLNGTDLGIYGGSNPYVPFGIPGIPRMQELTAPSTVTRGSGLWFRVRAKAFAE